MLGNAGGYMGIEALGFGAVAPVECASAVAGADIGFAATAAG